MTVYISGTFSQAKKLFASDTPRITLAEPCYEGRHLMNCPKFNMPQVEGVARLPQPGPFRIAPRKSCPRCDIGRHDLRYLRMMRVNNHGYRVGTGPSEDDCGMNFSCSVM